MGIIARIQVKTGTEADFSLFAKDLVPHSREDPGCLAYELWRVEDESEGSYAFMERYVDSAAADARRRTVQCIGASVLASMMTTESTQESILKSCRAVASSLTTVI